MRRFPVVAVLILVLLAIVAASDKKKAPPEDCPDGICPLAPVERSDAKVLSDLAKPLQVLEAPKPEGKWIAVTPPLSEHPDEVYWRKHGRYPDAKQNRPVVAENGWRLRVLYHRGSDAGLQRLFERNSWFHDFGKRYGYEAICSCDTDRFAPWDRMGYDPDRVAIVLINSRDRIVWRATSPNLPPNQYRLADALREAVGESPAYNTPVKGQMNPQRRRLFR